MSTKSVSQIFTVSKQGDFSELKQLLDNDPKLMNAQDKLGNTPLHYSASTRMLWCVKELVKTRSFTKF